MSQVLGAKGRPVNVGEFIAFGIPLAIIETERGGRPHLQCFSARSGSPFAILSEDVPSMRLAHGEVIIRTHGTNKPLRGPLLSSGYFKDTGKRVSAGSDELEIWARSSPAPLKVEDDYFPPSKVPYIAPERPAAKATRKR